MVAVAKRKQIDPDFGPTLRDLREKKGFSQVSLAELVGIAANTVARIERGEAEPTWGLARRLADALGVSLDAFRDGDEPDPEDEDDDADEPTHRPSKRK